MDNLYRVECFLQGFDFSPSFYSLDEARRFANFIREFDGIVHIFSLLDL